ATSPGDIALGTSTLSNGAHGLPTGGNAIQALTFGGTITDCTFTVTYNGQTTAAITWSSNPTTQAANIQNAMSALPNIGAGNVSVTNLSSTVYAVMFQNDLGTRAVATISAVSALGGTAPTVTGSNIV